AGAKSDLCNRFQRNCRSARGGHGEILERRKTTARILREKNPDRDLAVGEREFRRILVDIAKRRDTDRLTERCGRDTEVCSEIEPRRDDDFGPRNIALDPRRAKLLQSLHLVDDLERMFLERDRIVSAKDEGDVAAGKAARLALEAHARVGDCTELRLQAALPFDARHLAL